MEKLKISKSSWHYKLAYDYLVYKNRIYIKDDKLLIGHELMEEQYSSICSYGLLVFKSILDIILGVAFFGIQLVTSLIALGFVLYMLGSKIVIIIPVLAFSTNPMVMYVTYILYGLLTASVFIGLIVGLVSIIRLIRSKTTSVTKSTQSQKTNLVKEMILAKFGKYCKRIDFK